MVEINIIKGRDIPLKGEARHYIEDAERSQFSAIKPPDFSGFKARVLKKEGEYVQCGTPVIEDKNDQRLKVGSPISGYVREIRRGEKRKLLEIIIENDMKRDYVQCTKFSPVQISGLSRQQTIEHLLSTGSWAFIRQRPFDCIANPDDHPKSIFIKAMDTSPLAPDYDVLLEGKDEIFQVGLDLIQMLTDGPVYMGISPEVTSPLLKQPRVGVETVIFKGPHPAGNIGTHIHYLHPIDKGDIIWHLDAQDVAAIGQSFLDGRFPPDRIIAITGEKAKDPVYRKLSRGAMVSSIVAQDVDEGTHVISGNVLSGTDTGPEGFLGFYDSQISLIPRGGEREFLGWTMPGIKKLSFSHSFISGFRRASDVVINSDMHGSERSIVFNNVYDKYIALEVMTFFLIKAIFAGEIDEMERLGILECAPEDFALAQFACPSKTDVCGIIQQGLDLIKEDG